MQLFSIAVASGLLGALISAFMVRRYGPYTAQERSRRSSDALTKLRPKDERSPRQVELRQGDWTPDEILLTIEAHQQIHAGEDRDQVTVALASELHRTTTSVTAAVAAVGGGPAQSRILTALCTELLGDPAETRRRAQFIRELWAWISAGRP